MKYFLVLGFVFFSNLVQAQYTAKILDPKTKAVLFTMEHSLKPNLPADTGGEIVSHLEIKDPEGQLVFTDQTVLQGLELLKSEIQSQQLGVKARVEVKKTSTPQVREISFWKKDLVSGKEEIASEKTKEDIVIQSNFVKYVGAHWPQIQNGKEISFRFVSWERMESIGFKVKLDKKVDEKGLKTVVLLMKPTYAVIRMLVDPLKLTFSEDGRKLLQSLGRVTPKIKSGSRWKDLDALAVYSDRAP